jgi:hypothetical protein
VVTALLAWKTEFVTFSSKLTVAEIRGTLLLGFITVVVYQLLPDRFIDPWKVLNPRSVWLSVVIVLGLSFVNYVLLRQFGTRGIHYLLVRHAQAWSRSAPRTACRTNCSCRRHGSRDSNNVRLVTRNARKAYFL